MDSHNNHTWEMSNYLEQIKQTISNPVKIAIQEKGNLRKFYGFLKNKKDSDKYLRVIVKYLNGDGFVITAHFMRQIK